MDEAHLRANPTLVVDWARGWALSRGVDPPVSDHGGLRIEVGLPEQRRRHVFAGVCDGLAFLAKTIDEPWVLLKVAGPPAEIPPLLPPRWRLQSPTVMMTAALSADPADAPPAGYTIAVEQLPSRVIATINAPDGELAAQGVLGIVGAHAVFDQIRTQDAHQRRGLGRLVMCALAQEGLRAGAGQGVLVATSYGRALYTALGWRVHSLYSTALIPGPPADVRP